MDLNKFKKEVILNSLKDMKVELTEEFDRNFERQGFMTRANAWKKKKFNHAKGSILINKGTLRKSIRSRVSGTGLVFTSSVPYAAIHNEGGEITVTSKMKKYFWYQYLSVVGSNKEHKDKAAIKGKLKRKKDGSVSKSKRNEELNSDAEFYKIMALKKVGSKIKIPKRQFIGDSPEVGKLVEKLVSDNMASFCDNLRDEFKRNLNVI